MSKESTEEYYAQYTEENLRKTSIAMAHTPAVVKEHTPCIFWQYRAHSNTEAARSRSAYVTRKRLLSVALLPLMIRKLN